MRERMRERERENERQRERVKECERNTERDTIRDREWITVRNRKRERQRGWQHPTEGLRQHYGGQRQRRTGQQRNHYQVNWHDRPDVMTFYFTRFPEDTSEKELWYHFK